MSARNWQGIPDWLLYAVRASHVDAAKAGEDRAGEGAVNLLTNQLLADDPEFARVIVSRYVRSLVRAPKPRKRERKKARCRDEVIGACVRLDAEGLSLRAIGERLGISHATVRRMLAEWQTRLPEIPPDLLALSQPAVTQTVLAVTPQRSSNPNVIPLRRPA